MKIRYLIIAIGLALCVTMTPSTVFAKGPGQGHGHENDHRVDRGHGWDGDHGPGHRPPGWDKGKKTGWRGGALPPGQAKKQGYTGRRHYAHRDVHHDRYRAHRPVTTGTRTTTTTTTTQTSQARRWPYKPNPNGATPSGGRPAVFKPAN